MRQRVLREVMREVLPMLDGHGIVALIEPIGFAASSLKHKAELVDAIERSADQRSQAGTRYVSTYDRWCGPIFPDYTAMVHISGITDPLPSLDDKLDAHRGLVDGGDRCGTIDQIAAFIAAGYQGSFSFECTAAAVQDSKSLENDIRRSFDFIERSLASR